VKEREREREKERESGRERANELRQREEERGEERERERERDLLSEGEAIMWVNVTAIVTAINGHSPSQLRQVCRV